MNESHKQNEQKKTDIQKYILNDSIFIKFKESKFVALEVRIAVPLWE